MSTSHDTGIRRAVLHFGSQRALAIALGVTAVTVNQWVRGTSERGRPIPAKQCVRIEQLTSGAVSRRELRPDDWREIWPELSGPLPAQPAAMAGEGIHG